VSEFRPYLLPLFCLLAGCANIPDSYPPPAQRKSLAAADPSPVGPFVEMGDLNAAAYIVRDVTGGVAADSWRWTGKRPELRFFLEHVDGVKFKADFSVADATLKDTGPVTISVFINGALLDSIHCPTAGERHFEKPVPAKLLHAGSLNLAVMEIDKVWVSKLDGAALGFILTRAGFTQ
jgi:hypothetical protein